MKTYFCFILISFIFSLSFQLETLSELNLEQIRADILTNHNMHRKEHQVDNLERDAGIESVAQQYSEYLSSIDQMKHSDNGYGENLFYCYHSAKICVTGEFASQEWYNEVSDYDFDNPGFKSGTGHFTQLVWKGSKKIGCGAACNSKNKCYVTCNYYPAGNYIGQFDKNVFRKVSVSDSINAGMSTAGKVFLSIFIILIILIIAFSVFHFVVKKRKLRDIKNYFSKAY